MNKLILVVFLISISISGYARGVNIASATWIGINASVSGDIVNVNSRNYFKIYVQTTDTITVKTTGSLDTYGYILNEKGANIAFNDDGGSGFNFLITKTLSPGIYYIKVQAYNLNSVGSYFLSISSASGSSSNNKDTKYYANSISTASQINLSSTTSSNIANDNINDFFKISLAKKGTINIKTTGSLDTFGYLLDSSGDIITFNDDGSDSNFAISRTLDIGTYYIKVKAYNLGDTGQYSLVSSFSDSPTPDPANPTDPTPNPTPNNPTPNNPTNDDHGNSPLLATTIAINSTTSGSIETANDIDYFKINITTRGTINIHTTSSLDTIGNFLNSNSNTIASNDDGGSGSNFEINKIVEVGIYYIKVNAYRANTGGYSLVVSFSNAPVAPTQNVVENNDISKAKLVSTTNSTTYDNIRTSNEIDFFAITIQKSGILTIKTIGNVDTYGYLLNENGGTIAVNDDGGTGSNFKIVKALLSGNYKIKVKGYSAGDTGSYSLVVNFIPDANSRPSSPNN